jgi:hypothetical protein
MSCRCFVRHAITPEEREQAWENLQYCRRIGDSNGMILYLAQLQPCPQEKDNGREETESGTRTD